jgi:hypothetical protein
VNLPTPSRNALPRCGARFTSTNQRIEGIGATLDEFEYTPDDNQTADADTGLSLFTAAWAPTRIGARTGGRPGHSISGAAGRELRQT